jgi:hypothetical protein
MSDWSGRVILGAGEKLCLVGSKSTGFMQETDVTTYNIVADDGSICGDVTVTDHTAVRGFRRTLRVVQRNATSETIVDEAWNP